ncbi:MAG: ATP-binding protein [Desulfobacterales bacterium]|nr:ATP-binding protein [Desulfobacterales bacterium]
MTRRRAIVWRLFVSYVLITLGALFAAGWYSMRSLENFLLAQIASDLTQRARLLENQVAEHLSPPNPELLDAISKRAGRNSETRFTIILPDGLVVGDSRDTPRHMDNHAGRPEFVGALRTGSAHAVRFSETLRQPIIYLAVAVPSVERPLAVVRAAIPLSQMSSELARIRLELLAAGGAIGLLALGVTLTISRRFARKLGELQRGAARFAQGELAHRLPVPDAGELAGLADSLNRMAEQLEGRMQTVISQRNQLEAVLSSMLEGVIAVDGGLKSRTPMEDDIVVYQNGERILNIRSAPLLDAAQEPIGTLIVFNDVTQLRRLENMRRDFVANVSHEIKTPLTAIKGFVETLNQGLVENPAESKRFLEIVAKHVDRLTSVVEDLLMLSRIEDQGERHDLKRERTRLREILHNAVQVCRPGADEKQIRIEIAGDEALTALVDPVLIEQAVVNLLDNAVKYSDADTSVRLAAEQTGNEIRISVQDHGIGIERKHLPRLFERFYRVDKARSRAMGGTGLGLAIVKHISQAHGGHVDVASALSQGSTFTRHWPCDPLNNRKSIRRRMAADCIPRPRSRRAIPSETRRIPPRRDRRISPDTR